jgi:hypothetical protein
MAKKAKAKKAKRSTRKRSARKAPIRVRKQPVPAPPPDPRIAEERMREALKLPEGYGQRFKLSGETFRMPEAQREATRLRREEQLFPGSKKAHEQIEHARQQQPSQKHRRKRRGKLTQVQINDGFAYLRDHADLTPKQTYPGLRKAMGVKKADVSDITLWRTFWRGR